MGNIKQELAVHGVIFFEVEPLPCTTSYDERLVALMRELEAKSVHLGKYCHQPVSDEVFHAQYTANLLPRISHVSQKEWEEAVASGIFEDDFEGE